MTHPTPDFDVHDATVRVVNLRNLRRVDWMMPIFILSLAVVGWLTVYSATRSTDPFKFQKMIFHFLLGAGVAVLIIATDYRFLVAIAPVLYAGAIALLVGVLATGTITKGSERWLVWGPFRLQPSEIAKLTVVYALTWYFTTLGHRIRKLHWFLLTFLIAGLPIILILKQPNLGTAACLVPLVFVMLYVAGCRLLHLALIVLMGLSLIPAVWWEMKDFDPNDKTQNPAFAGAQKASPKPFYELRYHQKRRIYTFLNPGSDLKDSGWQTYQSQITVGSGGLFGKGYLKGTQTRLNYLPEHDTDFIFSVLAEERGFFGALVVVGLFAAFLLRGFMFARDCPEMMGTLLATGTVTILAFHVFVNIAITIGLMPVTGIPLPFLSYGGSFYLTTMACVGVLLNVPMRQRVFVY